MAFHTEFGIATIGGVSWGSHFCQLYGDRSDLSRLLVPYFVAGLANHERCIWVTAAPYGIQQAAAGLSAVFPDFRQRQAGGQITICGFEEWYLRPGPAGETTVQRWLHEERQALESGYTGLRVSGNTSFIEPRAWTALMHYEKRLQESLRGRRVLALCSYDGSTISSQHERDVVEHHDFRIGRKCEDWNILD